MPEPFLHLVITPEFDGGGSASAFSILMIIESPMCIVNDPLFTLFIKLANVPTQRYDGGAIAASDSSGILPLYTIDGGSDGNSRHWHVKRATNGNVNVRYRAMPRIVDDATPIGPRVDLRRDQGGLQGFGITFIPVRPGGKLPKQFYNNIVEWDLSRSPPGTRAVSTLGEAPSSVQKIGPADVLSRLVYAAGPLKSYPTATEPIQPAEYFGYYWFGDAPLSITKLGEVNQTLFREMSVFFKEPPSASNPYRIFVRLATPARGFGGTAGLRCFVLEYDASITTIYDEDIFYLLSHEMVHNWPSLEESSDNQNSEPIEWYEEGIAEYYSCSLPYKFDLRSKDSYLKRINSLLTQYYTHPLINMTNKEAQKLAWQTILAQTLPYSRGFVYFMRVNIQIRKASNSKRSLDDIVLALLEKKRRQSSFGVQEWLFLLSTELGNVAVDEYKAMAAGSILCLPEDCLSPKFRYVRHDQEMLEIGFDASTFNSRIVTGLREGSRAARAGLMEGDKLVRNSFAWQCAGDFERTMEMVVMRGGDMVEITYWPRSWETVESWRFVDSSSEQR